MISRVIKICCISDNLVLLIICKGRLCLVFSLSMKTNGSDGLQVKKIATKPEVTASNPRLLKQRSERALQLLWP